MLFLMSTFAPVDEQLTYIKKGSAEIIRESELRAKLEKSRATGKPLRVKLGMDPTAPDLHLGHTVVLRKLKHFQDLGHMAIFLIGDFTGMIGDPTGRTITRPPLSREQIEQNAETYTEQVFKILDPEKTIVEFNSRWLKSLNAHHFVRLSSKYTVSQMLERDDFQKRYNAEEPISIHEFIYPLCQGYDSVALRADVELGGTDQKFNLLVGRELQRGSYKRDDDQLEKDFHWAIGLLARVGSLGSARTLEECLTQAIPIVRIASLRNVPDQIVRARIRNLGIELRGSCDLLPLPTSAAPAQWAEMLRQSRKGMLQAARAKENVGQVALTMPILEGLDGVQKMSKSLGNAIGINDPPLEMYGKIMSISDEMMWRYYELLTDVQVAEIEKMKRESHPMQAKKDLARRIATDFHSAEAATKAGEDWAKQFQKNEVPESVEEIDLDLRQVWGASTEENMLFVAPQCHIKLDKLIALAGLADSATDAIRKLKQKAVKVEGEVKVAPAIYWDPRREMIIRVGKKIKRIRFNLSEPNVTFDDSKISVQKVVEDSGRFRLFVANETARFLLAFMVEVRNLAIDGKSTASAGKVKAQLSFRLKQGTYDIAPGAWLDEQYSSVPLDVGDTRRLILAVGEDWIHDWRMVTNKRTGPVDAVMLDYSRNIPVLADGTLEASVVAYGQVLRKLSARVEWKHNQNLMLIPIKEE
jgi:tyrosyl-tRNA synthetase